MPGRAGGSLLQPDRAAGPLRRRGGHGPIRAAKVASRHPLRPPLIGLTGGPGQAGVSYATTYDFLLPMGNRDLVMLDQRGTGASGLLRCPSLEGDVPRLSRGAAAEACARHLGARRAFYTSADSAEDLEALRIHLGAPRSRSTRSPTGRASRSSTRAAIRSASSG